MHLYASDILSMPDKYVVTTTIRVGVVSNFIGGNILTLRHGTALFTVFHSLLSTLRLPRSSLTYSPVNGT